jgi:hypothetical protein
VTLARRARRNLIALLVGLSVVMTFVASEWRLRDRVWRKNAVTPDLWKMILYSEEALPDDPAHVVARHPRTQLVFRLYDRGAELLAGADLRLNNLGFISNHDYQYVRGPNEFRIVVIGGEQTASTVVNRSWPDLLEDELNRRDSSIHYKVFNIAWPDDGPEQYVKTWLEEGVKFSPDLVIVNYVESDFFRRIHGAPLTYRGYPISHRKISYRVGPGIDDVARTIAPYVPGYRAISFRDSMVIPSRPYGFYASRAFITDQRRVRALQRRVVRDMIEGALPPFGGLTLRALIGKSTSIDVAAVRNFDQLPNQPVDKARMVQYGVSTLGWLADHVPHLILTHNFNYYELLQRFELTERMLARDPCIRVVDMRQRIPAGTSDREMRTWYLIPHMGEKWSARGHDVYGRMMADVVLSWRTGKLQVH